MANRERNSYDLRTLAHVADNGVGAPEIVDTAPVLRSDVLDGLQRYLAASHRAHAILMASGYYEAAHDAEAILSGTPGLAEFVGAMAKGCHAAAFVAATAVHVE